MMNVKPRSWIAATTIAAGLSLTLLAQQQPPPQPPQQPQQPPDVAVTISNSAGGTAPKLGLAGFIALSSDAETVAAAKTVGDVLYDDIAYEREYYMLG